MAHTAALAQSDDTLRLTPRNNRMAGAVLFGLAAVLLALAVVGDYALAVRALLVLGAAFAIGLALRCRQPSVTVADGQLTIRTWAHSTDLALAGVAQAVVLETWDGGVKVRKLAILTTDGVTIKSNYQSRPPRRGVGVTAADAAATALQDRIVAARPRSPFV